MPTPPLAVLVYVPTSALADRLFAKDFFARLPQLPRPLLVVHNHAPADPQGKDLGATRFLTKRISSFLSEQMVANLALSNPGRSLIRLGEDGSLSVHHKMLAEALPNVHALVTPLLAGDTPVPASQVLPLLQQELKPQQLYLFPENPNSALVAEPRLLSAEDDIAKLEALFPEEAETLALARLLAPVRVQGAQHLPPPADSAR